MSKFTVTGVTGEAFAKRVLKLAWDASGVFGMGALQDRGPLNSEDTIWEATATRRDYNFGQSENLLGKGIKAGKVSTDYVFGRMMKFNFEYGEDFVECKYGDWRADYQSFCRKYKDFAQLVDSAVKSFKAEGNEVTATKFEAVAGH